MTITQKEWFSIDQCLANPQNLYIFGDNTVRYGKGGQAQIRSCPNSFGIATKMLPTRDDNAYFDDSIDSMEYVSEDIFRLNIVSKNYENIVFPYDGLGTGLSEMPTRCPVLFEWMNKVLLEDFGFVNNEA